MTHHEDRDSVVAPDGHTLPDAVGDGARQLLRHTLATVAYRASKAVRNPPPRFGKFRASASSRSAVEIVAHMGDLFDWALSMATGNQIWHDSVVMKWSPEVDRFFASLSKFDAYLASDAPVLCSTERLFRGPIADALTHTGQLTMMRRLAGGPVRGENYARAHIRTGQTGLDQDAAVSEFD